VPATALTLVPVHKAEPLYAIGAHATVVADVHAALPHISATASDAVGVTTTSLPKLRPPIVTDPPPVAPTFRGLVVLTHGAGIPTKQRCELNDDAWARVGRAFRRWRLHTRSYRRR
jgi:hypothetical protein